MCHKNLEDLEMAKKRLGTSGLIKKTFHISFIHFIHKI